MKYVWMGIRLILPVAAIVLLGCYLAGVGTNPKLLLTSGLLCSTLGVWLNVISQRKERKKNNE
ncbi:MAG: hypothetical protein IJ438_01760 [Clostridia bacterium]|nr:hypothetical protein [Clostridia bacterium]